MIKSTLSKKLMPGLSLVIVLLTLLVTGTAQAQEGSAESEQPISQVQRAETIDPERAYAKHDFTFQNRQITLAGSLLLPPGEGPFPAVVMLHGAGPDTRDVFWRTGDALVFLESGVAVFIYDKRGTGESGGDWQRATIEDLAGDAIAAVQLVEEQPGINRHQVGVFGVSQGGRLTPSAAARYEGIDFLINVTGASVPFSPQERWSAGNELQKRGFSERALATTMKIMHLVVSSRPLIQSGILPVGDLYLWFDALDPYQDPLQDWRQVEQPAFIAYGAQDDTVPSKESAEIIERILTENGHPLSRLVVYPTAGHGIRLATGEWAPGHIETMTGWLKATLAGEPTEIAADDHGVFESDAQRWHGLGATGRPWYGSASFQLPLILAFVLLFGAGLLTALSPWSNLRSGSYGQRPRFVLAAASLLNLLLLAGTISVIIYLAFADANNAGPNIPLSTILPLMALASLGLAAGLIFFTIKRYREAGFRGLAWIVYGLVSAASAGFILFLAYWNILAPPM